MHAIKDNTPEEIIDALDELSENLDELNLLIGMIAAHPVTVQSYERSEELQ